MLFKVKLNHYQCIYPPLDVKEHSNIGLEWLEVLAVLPPDSECEVARYVCRHADGICHVNVNELEWEIGDDIYVDWEQSDAKLKAEQEKFFEECQARDQAAPRPRPDRADYHDKHGTVRHITPRRLPGHARSPDQVGSVPPDPS